jgi:hypothetical protein
MPGRQSDRKCRNRGRCGSSTSRSKEARQAAASRRCYYRSAEPARRAPQRLLTGHLPGLCRRAGGAADRMRTAGISSDLSHPSSTEARDTQADRAARRSIPSCAALGSTAGSWNRTRRHAAVPPLRPQRVGVPPAVPGKGRVRHHRNREHGKGKRGGQDSGHRETRRAGGGGYPTTLRVVGRPHQSCSSLRGKPKLD